MKFLPTKPMVKNMNTKDYALYYTVIRNGDDNEIVTNNENDYIIFNDIITPDHYVGIKPRETILK